MADEKKLEVTLMRLGAWPAMLVYVGIGALLHALIVGPQFDWQSAWTWGWLLGWPIAVLIAFWAVILGIFGFVMVIGGIALGWIAWTERRDRKEIAKMAKAARERGAA